jgi:hypothetical protein
VICTGAKILAGGSGGLYALIVLEMQFGIRAGSSNAHSDIECKE